MAGVNPIWSLRSPRATKPFSAEDFLLAYTDPNTFYDTSQKNVPNFVFEYGGMLVYSDTALIHTSQEPPELPNNEPEETTIPKAIKAVIEKGPAKDRQMYCQSEEFTPVREFTPTETLQVPDDGVTLTFDSKFESGNLRKAIKMGDYEYALFLRTDTGTTGNNHWYYFSVFNPRKTPITFKIRNMLKHDILYQSGMKPAVYSQRKFEATGEGWHRAGEVLSYEKTPTSFYAFTFEYQFQYLEDTVYFAYAVPYSYSELTQYMEMVKVNFPGIARIDTLCHTLGGNLCPLVTITNNVETYMNFESEVHLWGISAKGRKMLKMRKSKGPKLDTVHSGKKGVVLTARVHSGETVSSYMMQGVLDFLLGNSKEAAHLRRHFVFRIVPMLNPDGVRYGNYRTSLIGVDLNRRWLRPNKVLHPTIFYTKKMMEVFHEHHEIKLFCDLHGHTRKHNVFMYGCSYKSLEVMDMRMSLLAKVFPVFFSLKNKLFSFEDSHFRMEPDRKGTGRVVVFTEFGVAHSYTIEASFFGPESIGQFGSKHSGDQHMTPAHLRKVGKDLALLCLMLTNERVYMKKVLYTNNFLRKLMYEKMKNLEIPGQRTVRSTKCEEPLISDDLDGLEMLEEVNSCHSFEVNSGDIEQKIDDFDPTIARFDPDHSDKFEDDRSDEFDSGWFELDSDNPTSNLESEPTIEELWEAFEVVQYESSDEEGSGGSNSSVSETDLASPVAAVKSLSPIRHTTHRKTVPDSPKKQIGPRNQFFVLKNISEAAVPLTHRRRNIDGLRKSRTRIPVIARPMEKIVSESNIEGPVQKESSLLDSPNVSKNEEAPISRQRIQRHRLGNTYLKRKKAETTKEQNFGTLTVISLLQNK